jgi:sulfate adenylyltransferase subunit 1 (EFTu-like GTPase family)
VIRPLTEDHHDYRGYAGQVAGGVLRPGSDVVVLPSGQRTQVEGIDTHSGEVEAAFPTMSVALRFADHLDISRGDMIVEAEDQPTAARELEAVICWMSDEPLRSGSRYAIKHTTRTDQLTLNEIGRIHLRSSMPLMVDPYARNRTTGSFILIDEVTNDTVGAGMVVRAS